MSRLSPDAANGILSYFTRHKTMANLLLVILIVSGLLALPKMRSQFFPDIIIDNINISVVWQGAGAEDVDSAIVRVLEPVLLGVDGVSGASSTSNEGRARISLEFEPSWDMGRAKVDVETALDSVTSLPQDSEDPTIIRGRWSDRVTDVVISGPVAVDQLGLFADEFVMRLFTAGVTRTTMRGLAAPETVVSVPTSNLIMYDITMQEIAMAISEEVSADPAGDVDGANARVRTGVEKRLARDIQSIVLRSNPDGSKLTIADVAELNVNGIDRERTYFVGKDPAISIRVDRNQQGDAIDIQHKVETIARDLEATLPEGTKLELIRTRAETISSRLNMLLDNGLMGLGLVVTLLFLFLNTRTAFWVAAGIPTAMLTAIALMYAAGITINMISLFALIITLGIVVDDAIVVGEHADSRARSGLPPVVAAETAAQRMFMPVLAATITTVIAFFGLVAIGGRFGDLIADIPFTVSVVLLASLVECFLILPNHMAHSINNSSKIKWYDRPSHIVNIGFVWFRENLFRPFIKLVIRARYVVLAGTLLVLASQVVLFINGSVTWRFFNAPEQSSVTGNFAMVNSASRADTLAMMKLLQTTVDELAAEYEKEHGRNPVKYVLAELGGNSGRGLSGTENKSKDLLGGISVELIDADLRPYSSFSFVGDLQDRLVRHPLMEAISFRGWRSGPGGDALDIQFYGADASTLKNAAEALKTELEAFSVVSAVEDDLAYDKEEIILELTPQGKALGFTIDTLGVVLRNRLNGVEAASYPLGPRSATIRVELPEGELTSDFLERTQLRAKSGVYVPLADIVSVERQVGFSTVRRENGIRLISVTGDVSEDIPEEAEKVFKVLEEEILPEIASINQVEWRMSGLAEQEQDFLNDARVGMILTLLGIYLVLTWIFASWTRPFVIMSIIPFGLVGTIYGHYIWDVPMSMFTVVGLIGMTGIIINDSIVLISTIDEYSKERGIIPSIIDGSVDRLRPVLLTTFTTVLGLAPLLYERSTQAQFLKPTVITLVYGLGFGLLIVLLVIPALVAMQEDIRRFRKAYSFALRSQNKFIQRSFLSLTFAVIIWAGLTLGFMLVSGSFPAFLSEITIIQTLPETMLNALLLFLSGSFLFIFVFALVGYFVFWKSKNMLRV